MKPLDSIEIILEARELRAQELHRVKGVMAERLVVYLGLLGGSLGAALGLLRPLFSWNPQDSTPRRHGPGLLARANALLRACFSWNPQARGF